MQIGLVGLGRMGMNMGKRLIGGRHEVIAYNRTFSKTLELQREGAVAVRSLNELVERLPKPRSIWLMLPAGNVVDEHVESLVKLLEAGDLMIDGGNTYYKEDIRHAGQLKEKGIAFLDAGVSGGVWGLKTGYCIMVGGEEIRFRQIEPILQTLAPKDGYHLCGDTGAGHFVKMIHNGIEYGMMQAYAEGFDLLSASPYKIDLRATARLWNQGSVVRSWLLELAEQALTKDPGLKNIQGYVEDSGEGRWTLQQAVESGVATPVIALSLFQRFMSRQPNGFGLRLLAALRNEFGGHSVRPAPEKPAKR